MVEQKVMGRKGKFCMDERLSIEKAHDAYAKVEKNDVTSNLGGVDNLRGIQGLVLSLAD